jgi:hypothetical protein
MIENKESDHHHSEHHEPADNKVNKLLLRM